METRLKSATERDVCLRGLFLRVITGREQTRGISICHNLLSLSAIKCDVAPSYPRPSATACPGTHKHAFVSIRRSQDCTFDFHSQRFVAPVVFMHIENETMLS